MANDWRNERSRQRRNYGDWETGRARETRYESGRGGDPDFEEYRGEREYADDYPSYGSQYGRDRDYGYRGGRNNWSEQNRPYANRSRDVEDPHDYWPEQSNPYRYQGSGYRASGYANPELRRHYAPDPQQRQYRSYHDEPRGFGGLDTGGWGDQQRHGYDHPYLGDRHDRYRGGERGWWDRASDEVASWFGSDEAERRRRMDARHDHRGRGPKGYKRSDDRIREDLSDRLSDDSWLDASDIEIAVKSQEVTLTGTVDSRAAKYRAEMIAENCSGVSEVQNNLRVTQHTDSPNTFDTSSGKKTKTSAY